MKGLITILVLAALGGIFWLLFLRDPTFGVSDDAPIGTIKEIGSYLTEKDLLIDKASNPGLVEFCFGKEFAAREGLVPTVYLDSVPGFKHFVMVVQDPSGKVVGVAGQFKSELLEFSTHGAKSTAFIAKLWLAVTGEEATYKEARFGTGTADTNLEAKWTGPKAVATWTKINASDMRLARNTTDLVTFVLK